MLNIRRIIVILLILIITAGIIQYFRLDFFNLSEDSNTISKEDVYLKAQLNEGKEDVLVIFDENDDLDALLYEIEAVMTAMKLNYDLMSIHDFSNAKVAYEYIIMAVTDLNALQDYDGFFEYVEEGGRVLFPYRLSFTDVFSGVFRYLGILEHGDFQAVNGLNFNKNFMLNSDIVDSDWTEHIINSSIPVQLNSEAEILLTSNEGLSLAWSYQYGQGKMVYFNGSMLNDKSNRGLLLSLMNELRPIKIYPILNSHLTLINNMPSPIAGGNNEIIYEDYQRSTLRFYKEIWLPDMLEISKRYNLSYTTSLLGTYDTYDSQKIEDYFFIKRENLSLFGREILNLGGEIALGGFNNAPLTLISWDSEEEAFQMIDDLIDFFKVVFEQYSLKSYINKTNTIDEWAIEALKERGIFVLASQYYMQPDTLDGEIQIKDGYIEIPIMTSGYTSDSDTLWQTVNGVAYAGLISHAIGFDDIFDPTRSEEKHWKIMYEAFYDHQKILDKSFGWMSHQNLIESGAHALSYINISPTYERDAQTIIVNNRNLEEYNAYYIIELEESVLNIVGGEITPLHDDFYLLEISEEVTTITLDR